MASGRRLEISLQPRVLRWARQRASLGIEELARKTKVRVERVREWEDTGRISLAQVAKLSRHTHTPEGFLYLPEPPEDRLDIPDLRTVGDRPVRPSPDLLDTVHAMQRRQAWMREELIEQGAEPLAFVASADAPDPAEEVATSMRDAVGLSEGWAGEARSWVEALRLLRLRIDAIGVLVVANGVVGNNTHRPLDPEEFRGFTLVDPYTPLIFVNNADAKSAQMFTLAHELAHVWLDVSGVDNPSLGDLDSPIPAVEDRCNSIAAEFLIPRREFERAWAQVSDDPDPFEQLARGFKTSKIVAARRALELAVVTRERFFDFWEQYQAEELGISGGSDGGDFWKTQGVRLGPRFSRAIVNAVLEGRLLYREAYSLTDLRGPTFDTFVERIRGTM